MRKRTRSSTLITAQERVSYARNNLAYSLFYEFLPYYHTVVTELPAIIKLKLVLNDFTSIFSACQVLINDVSDKKMRREMAAALRNEVVWKHRISEL